MKKTIATVIVAVIATALIIFADGYFRAKFRPETPEPRIVLDTVYIERIDTVEAPVPVWREKLRKDTVWLTTVEHDTVRVELPIEHAYYRRDSTYEAWVSGYQPQLDSLRIYYKTKVRFQTTTYKVKTRWGVGIQAGVGLSAAGLQPAPYIGFGVSYNLFSW